MKIINIKLRINSNINFKRKFMIVKLIKKLLPPAQSRAIKIHEEFQTINSFSFEAIKSYL